MESETVIWTLRMRPIARLVSQAASTAPPRDSSATITCASTRKTNATASTIVVMVRMKSPKNVVKSVADETGSSVTIAVVSYAGRFAMAKTTAKTVQTKTTSLCALKDPSRATPTLNLPAPIAIVSLENLSVICTTIVVMNRMSAAVIRPEPVPK